LLYPGYDAFSQQVSELSAIGAPTRGWWVPVGVAYEILVIAFGVRPDGYIALISDAGDASAASEYLAAVG
jgi:hypothetical protein